ncbi:MAG TPA: DUF87 domain-containing protein [Candidatus Limnocylindria bacterium]|nr:DUF87 domain-containing protein [Candidatus Limnocylindria bacterium]
MADYEKLGVFYLGREWDPATGQATERPLLYDANDLTTHAVCVGMTGSGKTGLCIALLEEAALDGIPVIAIDPKGDLGSLALTFPALRPDDFRPFVDPQEAARRGLDVDAFAAETAARWRDGLAAWNQTPERIAALRAAAEVVLYTPGSDAGVPLGVLRSLAAPRASALAEGEALRDHVEACVSALLALVGVAADPVRSREHIVLSLIVERAWRAGRDLDLAGLIGELQRPGIATVGVVDLETFFPAADRFALAMQLNALLASPSFAAWLGGAPLDAASLLVGLGGRPRVSVVSIAHLSDRERMFVVTALLGEVLAWVRSQPGTSSLRAILYMDEVFGYLPPTAEPPSKRPLLTLLKQARASGLGVVLATQNPVDLDYKALSNAGTWFIGRLQTERDRDRLLDGLAGTGTLRADRARLDTQLAQLEKRVFLLHDVHEDAPVLFQSRWAMSYLRGPLSLAELRALKPPSGEPAAPVQSAAPPAPAPPAAGARSRPVVEPGVAEVVLAGDPRVRPGRYVPRLLATVRLHYVKGAALDAWVTTTLLARIPSAGETVDWEGAGESTSEPPLAAEPIAGVPFAPLPGPASRAATHRTYARDLADWLRRARPLVVWRAVDYDERSRAGESEAEFRARLVHLGRERRARAVEALRKKYASRLARAEAAVRRAEDALARQQLQYGGQKVQTAISVGATLLGAVLGRRLRGAGLGRATTAARHASRTAREREDVARAGEAVAAAREQRRALDAEFEAELQALEAPIDPASIRLAEERVTLRKGDVDVVRLAVAWIPEAAAT